MQEMTYHAYRGVYKRALELYEEENYREAFTKFLAVTQNDHDNFMANFYLAECYYHGYGTEKDMKKAYQNYCISAANHHHPSEYQVGYCFEFGLGVEPDETQAVVWYTEATKADDAQAEYRLGMCYKEGRGINQSYPLAASYLLKAARQGMTEAQKEAADCYEILNQPVAAATLYLAAADAGDPYSEEKMGDYFAEGYGCPKTEGLAIEYYTRAGNHGNLEAQLKIARRYATGDGLTPSISQAIFWWLKAAPSCAEAKFALADCYLTGNGVFKDVEQGMRWLEKAAAENNTEAMMKLADYSLHPFPGYEQDPVAAKNWWAKAAALGNYQAMYELGRCYEEAIGVAIPNYQEAYKWFRLASQNGVEAASDACKNYFKGAMGIKFKKTALKKKEKNKK